MMKGKRQAEILDIINAIPVETQEQLLDELKGRSITATQATISRDIKELHLIKVQTGSGSYRYAASARKTSPDLSARLKTIFRESVVSFDCAQNLVVIKTMAGLASAAGAALDGMDLPDLVGTLAGDDTVLLILRTSESARSFCADIRSVLG